MRRRPVTFAKRCESASDWIVAVETFVQSFQNVDRGLLPTGVVERDGVGETHSSGPRRQLVRAAKMRERARLVAESDEQETESVLERSTIVHFLDASLQD